MQETATSFIGASDAIPSVEANNSRGVEGSEEGHRGRFRKKPSPTLAGIVALGCAVAICAVAGAGSAPGFSIEATDSESMAIADAGGFEEGSSGSSEPGNGADSGDYAALEEICVYVTGAVANPGVYDLPADARVNDAVEAAGGLKSEAAASAVNLARLLSDGEQIDIPTKSQVKESLSKSSSTGLADIDGNATNNEKPTHGSKVNINTASIAELQALPGIGETLASRIVNDRTANGPFGKPSDLTRVSGIGEKKFAEMESMITVG